MANFDLPRKGSAAACALVTMHAMGGTVTVPSWTRVIGWKGTHSHFHQNVIGRLERTGLIRVDGDLWIVTNAGLKFLGVVVNDPTAVPSAPAGSRYVAPKRTLGAATHFSTRADAFEYRGIPSLMGGHRVEYRPGAVALDA